MPDLGPLPSSVASAIALAEYRVNDLDTTSATYNYYGFSKADGGWYILREHRANQEFRYATGTSGYTTAWTNRASESYDYYDVTF